MLADGGDDTGVDGLHLADVEGNEFVVTLFQGKYRVTDFDGTANFPGNGVEKVLNTVQVLFDPDKQVRRPRPSLHVRGTLDPLDNRHARRNP